MHGPIGARARSLSILVGAVLLLAWQFAAAQVAAAAGGPLDSSVYIACGYGNSTPNPPANCPTLDQAWASVLSQDAASAAPATLVLLPGDYCSLNVRDDNNSPAGTIDRRITIEGGGAKPGDVAFLWNSTDCGDTPPSSGAAIAFSHSFIEPLTLRNLSVDGSGGGSIQTGISVTAIQSPELTFRDVLVQHEPTGINVVSDNMQVTNSSFVNNQIGATMGGEWSVDGSTFAGNTNTGLSMFVSDAHLANDTIAHNGIGVSAPGNGSTVQVVNTIVGDNTNHDCSPNADWENASFNETNLLAAECITSKSDAADDIPLTDSIGSLDTADGITPYIPSPGQAIGTASSSLCGSLVGTDQLEETESGSSCDIGSIDSENTGSTPSVGPQPGALPVGHVPAGQTALESMTWTNIGAGLLQVTSVDATGDGLSVLSDGCTYQVLVTQQECFVTVGASPASPGDDLTGTLEILSNAIEQHISVTATGSAALAAPPGTPSVTVSPRTANLTWQASPSESQTDIGQYYVIQESVNGGPFVFADDVSDVDADTITHLTDGRAYEFEVCTEDDFTGGKTDAADAPCSAPTAAVTPYDTSSLTHPSPSTTKDGGAVKLSTTLSDGTTHGTVANATVTLLARPASGGTFHSAGTAKTASTGAASLTVKPTKNTQYEWQYAAHGAHAAATSGTWQVTVAQAVAATLAHTSIQHGKTGEVYGTVAPSASGLAVSLQYEHHGSWVTLTTAKTKKQTLPNNKKVVGYALKHTFASKGTVHLRVTRAATATNAAGVSKTLTLKVA